MNDPSILTIIVNYRTPELTLKSAAAALREMQGISGEIVIVDNHSQDDSLDLIASAIDDPGWNRGGRIRLMQSDHNGGFGAGNNLAMRGGLSNGEQPDFFYLLNSDAFPEPGAIRRLRDFMIAYPRAGLAGSHVRGLNGEPHCTAFRFPSIAGEFEGAARTGIISRLLASSIVPLPIPQTDTLVDWVAGASVMMRARMLNEIGLFDEAFFLYFEETELSRRAARAGWRTHYVPSSEVLHIGSASTGMKTWRRTPGYWFDSRTYYFTKTHGAIYGALATLARIGGCLIWRLRRISPNQPLGDPPMFLRDLVVHSLRPTARRTPQAARPKNSKHPIGQTLAEDRK